MQTRNDDHKKFELHLRALKDIRDAMDRQVRDCVEEVQAQEKARLERQVREDDARAPKIYTASMRARLAVDAALEAVREAYASAGLKAI